VSEKAHLDELDTAVTQSQPQSKADEARRTLEETMRTIAVRHGAIEGNVNFLPDRSGFFYKGPNDVTPVMVSSTGEPVQVTAVDDPM
jgi:hypothetical protein